ncbi:MAG: hypothetical protein DSM106950_35025 [Stigonema ocellatum SAG 48.90 = DSM 106950]|nr:hypothetical protein [Stigonema ocellatum SAG 48.90 = DSM 106950]
MKLDSKETFLAPIGDVGGTTGYAHTSVTSDVRVTANKYLQDSLLINKLTERVYELLLADLRYQRERVKNYGMGR